MHTSPVYELTVSCQACEAMVSKCGSEIAPHIPAIVELCLEYLTYDPNYNYEDGDDSDMECDDENDEGEGTDDEYSDDDDVSWKVRRAAVVMMSKAMMMKLATMMVMSTMMAMT